MLPIFEKSWNLLKSYWKPLIVTLAIVIVSWQIRNLFVDKQRNYQESIDEMKRIHTQQIETINRAHEAERVRHEKNAKKLEEDLKIAQHDYEAAVKELENIKKINIKKIVSTYGKDPTALAQRVQTLTGFVLVLPEKK